MGKEKVKIIQKMKLPGIYFDIDPILKLTTERQDTAVGITPHYSIPVPVTPQIRYATCQYLTLPQSEPLFGMRHELWGGGGGITSCTGI